MRLRRRRASLKRETPRRARRQHVVVPTGSDRAATALLQGSILSVQVQVRVWRTDGSGEQAPGQPWVIDTEKLILAPSCDAVTVVVAEPAGPSACAICVASPRGGTSTLMPSQSSSKPVRSH